MLCNALQCFAMLYNALQCFTMLCNALQCFTMLYNALQWFAMLYNTLQCFAMLCNAVTLKSGQTHSSLHYNIISFDDDDLLLGNKITIIECLLGSKKINLLTWPIIYHPSNVLNFSVFSFISCLNLRFIVSSLFLVFRFSFGSLLDLQLFCFYSISCRDQLFE
jgi:hypothetical protein